MRLLIATAALSAGLSGAASAQDFSLGTGISTLGPLVEGGVNSDDGFGLRAVATIPFDFDVLTIDFGADYDIDGAVNLGSAALLADYYPWGQGFRLTGGVFFGQEELVSGRFVGPQEFDGALVFENRIAPVLALGFRHQARNGFYVAGDLGAIITGFDATSNVNDPLLRAELDDINAVLEDIPVYPYLSISLGFTF